MLQPRAALVLALLLGVTGCTAEGEGSVTATGVGLVAPWWVFLVVLAVVLLLRRRRRR